MNRFKIIIGNEKKFESIWVKRDSYLKDVPGFITFHLVKGKTNKNFTLYASHSTWKTENDFINWTKSKSFRIAHKGAGKYKDIYIGHPNFEGFKVII